MNEEKELCFLLTAPDTTAPPLGSLSGDTAIEIQTDGGWTITGCYRNQVLQAVLMRKYNKQVKE